MVKILAWGENRMSNNKIKVPQSHITGTDFPIGIK